MIQLFKIDDSNFHAIFQQLTNKYEAFDRKSLEIENRMVKYNQRLQSTNMFASKYQRYESYRTAILRISCSVLAPQCMSHTL